MPVYLLPPLDVPILDKFSGQFTLPWKQYFQSLQQGLVTNTGSGIDQLTGDVTAGFPGATGSVVADLSDTGVTPGSYTNTDLTVDAEGRILAAANGTAGGFTPDDGYWGEVSNDDPINPELIFDAEGQSIDVWVPY